MEDKYIGLILAMASSGAIGGSFVLTKLGLEADGSRGESITYMKHPLWLIGTSLMAVGEIANFIAYTFAPPVLVTPLGALSVIVGAILASVFLGERLGPLGQIGCAICLLGSVIIVLHAPGDAEVTTVDAILDLAARPAFLTYLVLVTAFSVVMIFKVAPRYGQEHPMVYVSICSAVGSVSVCAIKAFGIALKLTLGGNSQLGHISTYVFLITVVVCVATQIAYFNRALAQFETSIVNPLYYVSFTSATLVASFILFGQRTGGRDTVSLLIGFVIIVLGVLLLDFARQSNANTDGGDVPLSGEIPLNGDLAYQFSRKSMDMAKYHKVRREDSFEIS